MVLDRTPILGEQGGQSWGGYSGLSIRVNQEFNTPEVTAEADSSRLWKGNWLAMGFKTLSGKKASVCLFQDPKYTPASSCWYVIADPKIPFFYFSPAVLYDKKIILKKGETLQLKYRIWILSGTVKKGELQNRFNQFIK